MIELRPLLFATPLLICVNSVMAQEITYDIDIPAQSLSSALDNLARQADIKPFFSDDLVAGKNSTLLKGRYTPQDALQKLLAGSGLTYTFTSKNAVAIKLADSGSDEVATLPAVKVLGKAVYDSTDPYNKSYTVTNSTTATKTDTPIFDTPVSIQVVPRVVMDDQKSTRLKDALENVSGVRAQPSLGFGNGFLVRGFRTDRVYRNGLAANSRLFGSEFDTANLESVEVLKGPAAVLFGRSEPGGLINITTKKPLDVPFYSLEQQFGSYDLYRTEWDATGPVNNDKSVLYRFTGSYQNNNSFRDLISNDRVTVSPSITWKLSDATDFTLNVEGLDQDYQADFGIPVIGSKPAPISIRNSFGDPNDPIDHISKVHLGTEFNHKFNQNWAIHKGSTRNSERIPR